MYYYYSLFSIRVTSKNFYIFSLFLYKKNSIKKSSTKKKLHIPIATIAEKINHGDGNYGGGGTIETVNTFETSP